MHGVLRGGGGEWLKLTASHDATLCQARRTNFATTLASPSHPSRHAAQRQQGTETVWLGPGR